MLTNKYSQLVEQLENDELEQTNIGGDVYVRLLAAYLYQNELADAKLLWKRIPDAIKTDNKELERLHVLMCAILSNNSAEFFKNINFAWSESIKQIMNDLQGKMRQDIFTLVGQAYISIFEPNLMQLTQLSREQLKEACLTLNWIYENNGDQMVVLPKRPPSIPRPTASSEDQLFKLTEFVSFLEN